MTGGDLTPGEIRAARKARGLTQEQAARQLEVSTFTWARWEQGNRTPTGLYARALERWMADE